MFSWFAFFRDGPAPKAPLDATGLDAVARLVASVPGLQQGLVMSPTPQTDHPFRDNGPAPALVLQLQFATIEALEAAVAVGSPLQDLAVGRVATQQAMLTRRFPVPDAALQSARGAHPCSFLVHYPGPAADLNAWHHHYNTHHPPLMARFRVCAWSRSTPASIG